MNINGIFKICLGISAIILSAAAFNLTIQPANAAPKPEVKMVDEETSKTGQFQVAIAGANEGDKITWTAILLNTENGKTSTYTDQTSGYSRPSFMMSPSDVR